MRQNRRSTKFRKFFYGILLLLGCFVVVSIIKVLSFSLKGFSFHNIMNYAENELQSELLDLYLPALINGAINRDKESVSACDALVSYLVTHSPSLLYYKDAMNTETIIEDGAFYDAIEKNRAIINDISNDYVLKENQESIKKAESAANSNAQIELDVQTARESQPQPEMPISFSENLLPSTTAPPISQVTYSLDELSDFTYLLSHFYTVDKTTSIDPDLITPKKMLSKDYSLNKEHTKEMPQILIYHTHSLEGYSDSNENDISTGVVGVGTYLSELMQARGYQVLHHIESYDKISHDQAYSLAAPSLEALLSKYPSIEIIIDIHRDGVASDRHLVTEINQKPTAQIMLFNGLSNTVAHGPIEYLKNPYIEDNLAFAFQIQLKCAEYYPTLARKIYLKGYRYNLHYRPRSLLLEVGAQTNSLEEAKNSMEPFAAMLDMVLSSGE